MDQYHVWCNLRPGISDVGFADAVQGYLGRLQADGFISGFRLSRRKLGFGPPQLGEFHLVVEVQDLAQLDTAFRTVSQRAGAIEGLHAAVNRSVCDFTAALYRDFPDAHRTRGQEQF